MKYKQHSVLKKHTAMRGKYNKAADFFFSKTVTNAEQMSMNSIFFNYEQMCAGATTRGGTSLQH